MLTHPTIDQLRALRLDGMAEAFVELQSQTLTKADLLILDDWGPDRLSANQRRDLMEIVEDRYGAGSTLITSVRRGCRLPGSAPARQGAVPATGNLPLDRRAPLVARHRAMRGGQVVAQLRAGAESLP